jgi:DNA helicase TIP49 (TBP-interacting protein)
VLAIGALQAVTLLPVQYLVSTYNRNCEHVFILRTADNVVGSCSSALVANSFSRPLRYALQLLAPAAILARLAGRDAISTEDIGEMGGMFLDAKTSAGSLGEGDQASEVMR